MYDSDVRNARWHRMRALGCCLMLFLALAGTSLTGLAATQNADTQPGDSLTAMLARVPATLPGLEAQDQTFISYADIAGQLASVGVEPPRNMDADGFQDWAAATLGLNMPAQATQRLRQWRELFGFDLLQADQTLEISSPPFQLTLYRGRFDEDQVRQALEDLDYTPVDDDHASVYSVRDDYEVEISSPTNFVLATMNFAAILPDGTLVFAPAREIIESVVELDANNGESLADRPDIAPLLPHLPTDLVSGVLTPGVSLSMGRIDPTEFLDPDATPDIDAMSSAIAEPSEMPPVAFALLGVTAGGPIGNGGAAASEPLPAGTPEARALVALVLLSPDAAEAAVPIIERRLATESAPSTSQPFAELFPEQTVAAVPDEPVLLIDLTLGEETPRNILVRLLYTRDLTFVAW